MADVVYVRGLKCRRLPPTRKHRLAIAPGILGSVYGVDATGHARYFEYDIAGALAFAGAHEHNDPRVWKATGHRSYVTSGHTECNPRPSGGKCLWVLR